MLRDLGWEGIGFWLVTPVGGVCPGGLGLDHEKLEQRIEQRSINSELIMPDTEKPLSNSHKVCVSPSVSISDIHYPHNRMLSWDNNFSNCDCLGYCSRRRSNPSLDPADYRPVIQPRKHPDREEVGEKEDNQREQGILPHLPSSVYDES